MKALKRILQVVAVVVLLPFVLAIFVDKHIQVKRTAIIENDQAKIIAFYKDLKNHKKFSFYSKLDSNIERSYKGFDGTVGSKVIWKSSHKKVGCGELEITSISKNKVCLDYKYVKPKKRMDQIVFVADSIDNHVTHIQFIYKVNFNYPNNLIILMKNLDNVLGNDVQKHLNNFIEATEVYL
jgi:hypothetical protein